MDVQRDVSQGREGIRVFVLLCGWMLGMESCLVCEHCRDARAVRVPFTIADETSIWSSDESAVKSAVKGAIKEPNDEISYRIRSIVCFI